MSHKDRVSLLLVEQSRQKKRTYHSTSRYQIGTIRRKMIYFIFLVYLCLDVMKGNPLNSPPIASPDSFQGDVSLIRNLETNEASQQNGVVCDDISSCATKCPYLYGHKKDDDGCEICAECRTSGLFEGDIEVDDVVFTSVACAYGKKECYESTQHRGAATSVYSWPKTGDFVTIGYTFEGTSQTKRTNILNAIAQYNRFTCIRFVPRTTQVNYITFAGDETPGCSSFVGYIKRARQRVKIGENCDRNQGTILHELMHALGFWHEQSRGDRDLHVEVKINNVEDDARNNFEKRTSLSWDPLGSPYDLSSVMHYGGTFFAKGNLPTITEIGRSEPVLAQRYGFSEQDLFQINTKYSCTAYLLNTGTTVSTTTVSLSNCRDALQLCPQAARQGLCQFSQYRAVCLRSCTPCAGTTPTTSTTTSTTTSSTTSTTTTPSPPSTTSTTTSTTTPSTPSTTSTTTSTTTPSTVSTSSSTTLSSSTVDPCRDLKEECRNWAHQNFCNEEFVDYMRVNCPKACGHCTPVFPPTCEDDFRNCGAWADNGECTSMEHETFMKAYCKQSCTNRGVPLLCGPGATTLAIPTTTPRISCVDIKLYCQHWARKGYCNEEGDRGNQVRRDCPQSCGSCGGLQSTTPVTPSANPVVAFANGACGRVMSRGRKRKRVVGGKNSAYGANPWMVSLQRGSEHFCGATLISNQHIITAAHCFYSGSVYVGDLDRVHGYLGKQRLMRRDVGEIRITFVNITIHPLFDHLTRDNDIAILQISSQVTTTNYVIPVCLPGSAWRGLEGYDVTTTGWGRQKRPVKKQSNNLQEVNVRIISNLECQEWLNPYINYKNEITTNMLCAGNRNGGGDSCQGDDGGPLVLQVADINYLLGIVSWGYDCGEPNRPGVYTRIIEKLEWINGII